MFKGRGKNSHASIRSIENAPGPMASTRSSGDCSTFPRFTSSAHAFFAVFIRPWLFTVPPSCRSHHLDACGFHCLLFVGASGESLHRFSKKLSHPIGACCAAKVTKPSESVMPESGVPAEMWERTKTASATTAAIPRGRKRDATGRIILPRVVGNAAYFPPRICSRSACISFSFPGISVARFFVSPRSAERSKSCGPLSG